MYQQGCDRQDLKYVLYETWVRQIMIVAFWLEINPENGDSMFLRNVGVQTKHYKAQQRRGSLYKVALTW
jgi:hypothetical protein